MIAGAYISDDDASYKEESSCKASKMALSWNIIFKRV